MNGNNVTYYNCFGVEQIPKETKKSIGSKNIIANIHRIQVYDSGMCGYFCIGFINFMFKDKILTNFTNLLLPKQFKDNNKIILNYFLD